MRKTGTNTTLNNLSKQTRLSSEHIIPKHIISHKQTILFLNEIKNIKNSKEAIIYNLGKTLIGETNNPITQKFLDEQKYPKIQFNNIPEEFDLLGAAYQYLNTKYENLEKGSFYTSKELAQKIVGDYSFNNNETIIDLSCGSGIFLFCNDAQPEQIFGVDFDPIAVMIAKFNFFLKFPDTTIYPQIYNADFLEWYEENKEKKFTYVVGNPPYGANLDLTKTQSKIIKTGESFSYFIEYGFNLMKTEGKMAYLLPEALLNVKRHIDIRDFILDKTNLTSITLYESKFAGVMSDIYLIEIDKGITPKVTFQYKGKTHTIPKMVFKELKNHIFAPSPKEDMQIIDKVKAKSKLTLKNSDFALGVVTGNNKEKLLPEPLENTEPIYTGKEIAKYQFLPPTKHIVFDRTKLQQVAPEKIYRAPKKLVYKVISKRLKVAIDTNQNLTSSSANIIIPIIENNTIYSVALLLNSDLYSFLNQKLHGATNKVSRGNLEALPFPSFTKKELNTIKNLITQYLKQEIQETELQEYVNNFFELTTEEKAYIQENLE